ncbi:MAG TPA: hypothetical protein VMV62_02655 [Candidatus Paceibacterota bacterium]|nr:hypothetical protein [Candidatus Paceibacterota bacterium]
MRTLLVLFIALISVSAFADCITYDGRQFCDTGVAVPATPAPPVVYYQPAPVYVPPPVVYYPAPTYYYPPRYYVNPVDLGVNILAGAIVGRIIWGGHHHDRDEYRHRR